MKTKDEQKVRLSPRVPRVALKSNSQIGLQDQQEQDARSSCDQPSGSKLPWETCNNIVDYRIPGVPLSAVEQQETHRKDKVKQLIEKFENHPNKESFLQAFKQTKEINEFSKESPDLIADMNNTELFELCETSSKQQCLDCNLYWEAGIVYCSCGRFLRMSRNDKEVDKSNHKKNNKRGARHGPSVRQRMHNKAREMLHIAGRIGWSEKDIMLFDRIALENHRYVATRAERIRH